MEAVTTHPNVGGVVLVSLGCESFDRERLQAHIAASGRPVELYVIQQTGGTAATIAAGLAAVARVQAAIADCPRVPMRVDELVIGTICGGSDATGWSRTGRPASSRRPANWSAAKRSWRRARSRPNWARRSSPALRRPSDITR
jgi:altronate dehydratase large subunit